MKPTATELWEKALSLVEERLSAHDFGTWIKDRLSFVDYDRNGRVLVLGVDSEFCLSQVELKYADVIGEAASEVFGVALKSRLLLPEEAEDYKSKIIRHVETNEIIFNPRHTFDNFILGDNNRFAAKMALEVAMAPGKTFSLSPLFIYSAPGLGKTHLMHAIGIYILEHFPELRVLYVSAETFTNDFVNASFDKKWNEFKEKYRSVDVLLIDDIQFINEREKTAEEVFNTYEALYNSGKQMVFSSDMPPKDFLETDERLRRRLGQGMLVDLKPPSYEIKVAILKNKAALNNLQEDEGLSDVISFIAENIKTNVSDLEAALNRVVLYAKHMGKAFSKALAKEVLSDVMQMSGVEPSTKDIKKAVANYFEISVASIDSKNRAQALAIPRQIAMYLCYTLKKTSFPKIADSFNKDYSTVHHAYNKIRKETETNEQLEKIIKEITTIIQNNY